MKQDLARLRTLITQLAQRLQSERDARIQLTNQLAVRDGELKRARDQLHEMKRKLDAMCSSLRDTNGNA